MKYSKLPIKIYTAPYPYIDTIPDSVPWVFQGVYLHGKISTDIGNDLTFIDTESEQLFHNKEIKEGIYSIDVVDSFNNVEYNNYILYFWYDQNYMEDHWYRGLICDPSDTKSIEEANIKYINRDQFL